MSTISIPKKFAQQGDLVVIPRREYEKLVRFWTQAERLTKAQSKSIKRGLREISEGHFLTSQQLKRELGL